MSNHEEYTQRLEFLIHILDTHGVTIDASNVTPLDYDPDFPFAYNNFIYLIDLPDPTPPTTFVPDQPTAIAIPAGTTKLIFRISNAKASGINQTNRVQNEVISMDLAREALGDGYSHVIPQTYDWGVPDTGVVKGWVLMEWKEGVNLTLEKPLEEMSERERMKVIDQMADVYARLKAFVLPDGIDKCGGLTFDDAAKVTKGQMTTAAGGPYGNYRELWKAFLQGGLDQADKSKIIKGWEGGLRERIDKYLGFGMDSLLQLRDERLVLTHGDFGLANALFTDDLTLTAILDFDFSYISYPQDDILRTMHTLYGNFPGGPVDRLSPEGQSLRQGMLHGFKLDDTTPIDVRIGNEWDRALKTRTAPRSGDLDGMEELGEIMWFSGRIAPMRLCMEHLVRRMGEEKTEKMRKEAEEDIDQWLAKRDF